MKRGLAGARIQILGGQSALTEFLVTLLSGAGIQVSLAGAGPGALARLDGERPDLVLVVSGPPHQTSQRFAEAIAHGAAPVVPVVHGICEDESPELLERYATFPGQVVFCHSKGMTDFCRPCLQAELLHRISWLLRRPPLEDEHPQLFTQAERTETGLGVDTPMPQVGGLFIDLRARRVYRDNIPVQVRPTEFRVLAYLAANEGRAITREELLNNVWGYEFMGGSNLVDATICSLRHKIEPEPTRPRFIQTVRGFGYRLDNPQALQPPSSLPSRSVTLANLSPSD